MCIVEDIVYYSVTTSANPDFGYVTLCDTMDSMILWTEGTLLQTNLNTS